MEFEVVTGRDAEEQERKRDRYSSGQDSEEGRGKERGSVGGPLSWRDDFYWVIVHLRTVRSERRGSPFLVASLLGMTTLNGWLIF